MTGALGVVVTSRLLGSHAAEGPILCPFRLCFGLPCPGCGLTRAFAAIAQGHFGQATGYHILAIPLFAGVLIAMALWTSELVRGRLLWPAETPLSRRAKLALIWCLLVYDVARIGWMWRDGSLVTEYVSRSWWYHLTHPVG